MWCEGSQGAREENAWTHDTLVRPLDEQPAAELCLRPSGRGQNSSFSTSIVIYFASRAPPFIGPPVYDGQKCLHVHASLRGLTAQLLYVGTRQRKQQKMKTQMPLLWFGNVMSDAGVGADRVGRKKKCWWKRSPEGTLKQSMGQWESRYRTLVLLC